MSVALSELFTLTDAFAQAAGISESTLSGRMLNGGNRLRDLRAGKGDIGVRRLNEALQWLSDHWPADLTWPPAIPRPTPHPVAETAA